eukprot:GILI01016815.1.p1 GENE.GILI01016815.1~~GILI01016815.1.p1  ORF type:complete len:403 (-),score=127.49 GILI01016815.1:198-1349(-)
MSAKLKLDYSNEPAREPIFVVNSEQPFNAEPTTDLLTKFFITPTEWFYVRGHGPVPELSAASHFVEVEGAVNKPLRLSLEDLRSFPKKIVTAVLECAGNRRNEMSVIKKVKGLGWYHGAISNAVWGGCLLKDVLEAAGIKSKAEGARHVEFLGADVCEEDNGTAYGSSIPVDKVLDLNGDVLLAYEMNGEPLTRDHGYPIRVIVPGYIGARSVKWLKRIVVRPDESQNYFQQRDYKLFGPQVDWDTVDQWWDRASPIQELNLQCGICVPQAGALVKPGPLTVSGYALSGGRRIERVEVSLDGGKTWHVTELAQEQKTVPNTYWAWCLWRITVDVTGPVEIIARAWDSASNVMPENVAPIWNLRGVMNNAWHRVPVNTSKSAKL